MKTILKMSVFMLFASFIFNGCKKDETKLYYTGGTAPVLSATATSDTVNYANDAKTAFTLKWTNPNYSFTTGVSSLDVNYSIYIDSAGKNFSNNYFITVNKDLTYSFTSSQLNDIMLNQLNLQDSIKQYLEFKVVSNLTNNSVILTSNAVQYSATPYVIPPKVPPPVSGTLYITGSATNASWQCGCGEAAPADQTFTKTSPTKYELTTQLKGGGSFLLIPHYGTWNAVAPDPEKYGFKGANNANKVNGDDFVAKGGDILAPASDGTYKIVVDFQKGKYSVTKQ